MTVVGPSAARIKARLVILFDPGKVTPPRTGPVKGMMGRRAGREGMEAMVADHRAALSERRYRLGRRAKLVAIIFPTLEDRLDICPIAISECALKAGELGLIMTKCVEDFVAILFEDRSPKFWVTTRDAGRIAEPSARVSMPLRILALQGRAKRGGEDLRQMADMRDDFVVDVRCYRSDLTRQRSPESRDVGGGGRRGLRAWGDKYRAADKKIRPRMRPARFF